MTKIAVLVGSLSEPVAVAGASIGPLGTSQAQQALRNALLFLNTKVMGQPEAYIDINRILDGNGEVREESKQFLADYAAAVVNHVESNKA